MFGDITFNATRDREREGGVDRGGERKKGKIGSGTGEGRWKEGKRGGKEEMKKGGRKEEGVRKRDRKW